MERTDIEHLARLARIAVTDSEADKLAKDITSILGYVSEIEAITGSVTGEKKVGALANVMRPDSDPHTEGVYTEDLLQCAPDREGQYLRVKKIIGDKS